MLTYYNRISLNLLVFLIVLLFNLNWCNPSGKRVTGIFSNILNTHVKPTSTLLNNKNYSSNTNNNINNITTNKEIIKKPAVNEYKSKTLNETEKNKSGKQTQNDENFEINYVEEYGGHDEDQFSKSYHNKGSKGYDDSEMFDKEDGGDYLMKNGDDISQVKFDTSLTDKDIGKKYKVHSQIINNLNGKYHTKKNDEENLHTNYKPQQINLLTPGKSITENKNIKENEGSESRREIIKKHNNELAHAHDRQGLNHNIATKLHKTQIDCPIILKKRSQDDFHSNNNFQKPIKDATNAETNIKLYKENRNIRPLQADVSGGYEAFILHKAPNQGKSDDKKNYNGKNYRNGGNDHYSVINYYPVKKDINSVKYKAKKRNKKFGSSKQKQKEQDDDGDDDDDNDDDDSYENDDADDEDYDGDLPYVKKGLPRAEKVTDPDGDDDNENNDDEDKADSRNNTSEQQEHSENKAYVNEKKNQKNDNETVKDFKKKIKKNVKDISKTRKNPKTKLKSTKQMEENDDENKNEEITEDQATHNNVEDDYEQSDQEETKKELKRRKIKENIQKKIKNYKTKQKIKYKTPRKKKSENGITSKELSKDIKLKKIYRKKKKLPQKKVVVEDQDSTDEEQEEVVNKSKLQKSKVKNNLSKKDNKNKKHVKNERINQNRRKQKFESDENLQDYDKKKNPKKINKVSKYKRKLKRVKKIQKPPTDYEYSDDESKENNIEKGENIDYDYYDDASLKNPKILREQDQTDIVYEDEEVKLISPKKTDKSEDYDVDVDYDAVDDTEMPTAKQNSNDYVEADYENNDNDYDTVEYYDKAPKQPNHKILKYRQNKEKNPKRRRPNEEIIYEDYEDDDDESEAVKKQSKPQCEDCDYSDNDDDYVNENSSDDQD